MNKQTTRRKFLFGFIGAAFAVYITGPLAMMLKFLWPPRKAGEEATVVIAKASEVPVGSAKEKWQFEKFPAILIHNEEGFRAFAVKCTHLGCTAQWRVEYGGYKRPVLFCPCHDGIFDTKTGKVLAGPPPAALPEIQLEEKDGKIIAVRWKDLKYVKTLDVYKT
ncbi:Rieske (2Fe-2S) protein [Candidatus Woesearchaeota archaeon]|nr:Rieske (2Fe-2S) protein [Candidatus Woesearchaeota archaeon]